MFPAANVIVVEVDGSCTKHTTVIPETCVHIHSHVSATKALWSMLGKDGGFVKYAVTEVSVKCSCIKPDHIFP